MSERRSESGDRDYLFSVYIRFLGLSDERGETRDEMTRRKRKQKTINKANDRSLEDFLGVL
jgi:predicted ATPase